jgi:hypothetical protein
MRCQEYVCPGLCWCPLVGSSFSGSIPPPAQIVCRDSSKVKGILKLPQFHAGASRDKPPRERKDCISDTRYWIPDFSGMTRLLFVSTPPTHVVTSLLRRHSRTAPRPAPRASAGLPSADVSRYVSGNGSFSSPSEEGEGTCHPESSPGRRRI